MALSRVREHLYFLAGEIGSRLIGTPGNHKARLYVSGVLRELGCMVHSQRFARTISLPESGFIELGGRRWECWPCLGTPSFGPERCFVTDVGIGGRDDWERADIAGHVAMCKRGELHESVKVELAARQGAKAVLFYVDFEDCLYSARAAARMADIPAAVIRPSLARSLGGEPVELGISSSLRDAECANLWCEIGDTSHDCIVLCAHYDSRPFTAGANDNAAGVSCLLELAHRLSSMEIKNSYRCIFFDSEEADLAGSKAYVAECGVAGIRKVVNIDAVGFGRPKTLLSDRGGQLSAELANRARQAAASRGLVIGSASSKTGLSDHGPFRDAGVSECLWISDHPNQGRETDLDVPDRIDTEHLEELVNMYVDLLEP